MLDKEVFFNKFDELLIAYPNWKLKFDDVNTTKFWYNKFIDMTDHQFTRMVDSYVKTEKFNPTIGGLLEHDTLPIKTSDQINHEAMLKEMGML